MRSGRTVASACLRVCAALPPALAVLALGADGVPAAPPASAGVDGPIVFTVQQWQQPPCDRTVPAQPHSCPEPEVLWARTEAVRPDGRGRRVLSALDEGLGGWPSAATAAASTASGPTSCVATGPACSG